MNEEMKSIVNMHIGMLKETMKSEGLIFGIVVNKTDVNESKLAFVDRDKYLMTGKVSGITISLTELNDGLL